MFKSCQAKIQELLTNKEIVVKLEKEMWDDFKPRAMVVITGENVNVVAELETLQNFIQLEADPIRRSALVTLALKKKGIDVDKLPKTPDQQLSQQGEKQEPKVGAQNKEI